MADQPLALQITAPAPGKEPIEELRRVTNDANRILALLQGEIDDLRDRIAALEKKG